MKLHRFITALAFVALTISLFSSGDSLRAYAEAAHQPGHASEGDVIHITTTPQEIATTTQDVPTGTGSSGDVIHITTTIPGATTAAQDATAQSTTSTSATSGTEAATTAPTATSTTVPTSPPAAEADYLRLGGSSRIDTACKIADELLFLSREEGTGGSGCMVIANGYNFPDALAGVSLAASFDAPIMLTGGKQLEASVLERIRALEPETVYILGGKSVVSQDIESYLTAMGAQTIRLYGEDRYATAIEICKALPGDSDRLFVVSGENYPDALSVSPVAGICRAPIVFSNSKGELTPQAIQYISQSGFSRAYVIGGRNSVGQSVEQALRDLGIGSVERISGSNRYETSAGVYRTFRHLFDAGRISFAVGTNYPDALAGSVYSAAVGAPILLVENGGTNIPAEQALTDRSIAKAVIYGDKGVLSDNTVKYILDKDLSTPTTTTTKPTTAATTKKQTAQDKVNSIARAYGAVGVQVAVIDDGKVTGTYNYGWATKSSVKMASDIKIRVASISKVAVGVCALKLQEQGKVSLSASIGKYWDSGLPKAVTLQSLLSHTSTLYEKSYASSASGTLSQLKSSDSYRSGTVGSSSMWAYNNYGIGIAGATLEVASGQTLNQYAQKNVFRPLGMDAAFFSGRIENTSRLATLYYAGDSVSRGTSTAKNIKGYSTPGSNAAFFAGGLTCSAEDLAALVAMLANDGTYNGVQILTPESVSIMEKKLFTKSQYGGTFSQCLPLRYKDNLYGESGLYYHTGNAYGVLSLMSYNPYTGDGVVVITTGASAERDAQGIYQVCAKISEYMYRNVV